MKKLFLSSSFVDVAEFLEPFVGKKLKGKTVTFIPTASIPEAYKGYVENDRKALKKLGLIIDELDISITSTENIKDTIQKNAFIYVSGGNTFFLLKELKNSGTDEILLNELKKRKPYIGVSAGAIVMSKSIDYIEKMDNKTKVEELKDYNSLAVVDFYTLPHHTNEPFKNAVEEILTDYYNKINLIPISNTEVILVKGNEIKIAGKK